MAWQHQGFANWCTSFLGIPWWVGCWGWHHFQRKTNPHPRESASRHSCPTPSVSSRNWEDLAIGQRRGVLAKHQQRYWTNDRTWTLCQELENCNRKEPLIPHDTPMAPWKKLGTDLFEVDGEHFLLICDYFSKYPIVTPLHATASENVTEEIRKAVSLFGRPDEIVSDNVFLLPLVYLWDCVLQQTPQKPKSYI